MIFLGTASAAGYPNPFCDCKDCRAARETGDERDIRVRSSLLLDEHNLIDFSADVLSSANRFRLSLHGLKNLFLTHSHEDHFDYWNLEFFNMAAVPGEPFCLYASPEAAKGLQEVRAVLREVPFPQLAQQFERMERVCELFPLAFYETVRIDGMKVTPLRGRHAGFFEGEQSANYFFEREEGSLLYACDTGRFYEETYEWLVGRRLDILAVEGTFGLMEISPDSGHMNAAAVCSTVGRLRKMGVLDEHSRIYVTHISPKGGLCHRAYENYLQERLGPQVRVAYDGLRAE